jgi:hypothetical protein
MMERFAYRLNCDDKPLDKSELIAAVGDPDVLVPTVDDRIDGEVVAVIGPEARSTPASRWARWRLSTSRPFFGEHRTPDRVIGSML